MHATNYIRSVLTSHVSDSESVRLYGRQRSSQFSKQSSCHEQMPAYWNYSVLRSFDFVSRSTKIRDESSTSWLIECHKFICINNPKFEHAVYPWNSTDHAVRTIKLIWLQRREWISDVKWSSLSFKDRMIRINFGLTSPYLKFSRICSLVNISHSNPSFIPWKFDPHNTVRVI